MTAERGTGHLHPNEPVRRGWTLRFNLAWVGVIVAVFAPLQILLPNQAERLAPEHKELVLALVVSLGGVLAMVINPLWGALSDRTTSRHGRRLPWIAIGAVVAAAGLMVLAGAPSVLAMVLGWCLVQAAVNAPWAALSASFPDQVPSRQRGVVAGYLGLASIAGVILGAAVATVFPGPAGYLACALVLVLAVTPYLLLRRDRVLDPTERTTWHWRTFVRGFWVSPAQHPDFGWAWLTRSLVTLGNAMSLIYLLYFLRDALGRDRAEADVLVLGAVYSVGVAVAALTAGRWSDRVGRRKPFVVVATLTMASAAFVLALFPAWPAVVLAALVLGLGFGVYTSVAFALVTEVLPPTASEGKDMGLLSVAVTMPQVVAPAVAALLVTQVGGYPTLFLVGGLVCALGGVTVSRIRSVR